ncbi:MAG TPA: fumarylacetoacetate hydrolase family protein [Conexibacter sp.]|nr:fumarylacetoacetate hydrolase family protein [Conexibacter sp.]
MFETPTGETAVGRIEGETVIAVDAPDVPAYLTSGGVDVSEHALCDVTLLAPVPHPPSVRDFYCFHGHAKTAMARRGREVPPEWYRSPRFYFSNAVAIIGPESEVGFPDTCAERDYELELAAIVGTAGRIAGFTIMNDWSARDLQREEMTIGLGPVKGKDFATSLGPCVLSADAMRGRDLAMIARVNGEVRTQANSSLMYHSWDSVLAYAARDTRLQPGDILGSGTVDGGCILEHGDGRWLQPGDVVELEIEGIGVLRNRVASPVVAASDGAAGNAELAPPPHAREIGA